VTQYAKAPITEALIDIQVRSSKDLSLAELEKLSVLGGDDYHLAKPLYRARVSAQVDDAENISAEATKTQRGWAFANVAKVQVWQAKLDGFTFSRLAPYEAWEPFRAEARRLWNVYREATQPEEITRIAVRYINRLDFPLPFGDFKEYLRATPEIPPELPQLLAGYFFQFFLPQEDVGAMLALTQGLVAPVLPDHASVVLDIDLFRENDVPADENMLWDLLERFREKKDAVFEACITEKTRRLIR
jgi:uncharacterized protein (TIGR04255 family)